MAETFSKPKGKRMTTAPHHRGNNGMTVVHLASNPFGGAGIAARRLHEGLMRLGVDSRMLTLRPPAGLPNVSEFDYSAAFSVRVERWFRLRWQAWRRRKIAGAPKPEFEQFSLDSSTAGRQLAEQLPPNAIIHLHWVSAFVDHLAFFPGVAGRRLVWTMHDMNPFTGGCHFDNGCGRFVGQCGECPQLGSTRAADLSREIWTRKKRGYDEFGPQALQLVAPSRWLAGEARKSSLLGDRPCVVIPNGLDTAVFAPMEKARAREMLGLPREARIVLGSSSTPNLRKGIGHFEEAIARMKPLDGLFILSVGPMRPKLPDGLSARHMGAVDNEELLAAAYSAADVFVISSIADNLPNTVLESMSCGTPVAGYNCGGVPDLVESGETGLLAQTGDAGALARAIETLLSDSALREHCSRLCRARILSDHTLEVQARRYLRIYSGGETASAGGQECLTANLVTESCRS